MQFTADDLRLPEEWEAVEGIRITDPDGWRNTHTPWDQPLSYEEFLLLSGVSTVEILSGRHSRPQYSAAENGLRIRAQANTLSELFKRSN